jgi:pilus assembly protein CpaB
VVKPDSASYVIGQRVLVPLQAGDPRLWSQFETSKAAEKLSTIVQTKGRASPSTYRPQDERRRWFRPTTTWTSSAAPRPESGEQIAVTLMQNVVVLATARSPAHQHQPAAHSERTYNN